VIVAAFLSEEESAARRTTTAEGAGDERFVAAVRLHRVECERRASAIGL
jgi:hypothetical protein